MHIGFFSTQLSNPGGPGLHDFRALQQISQQDRRNTYTVYDVTGHDTERFDFAENFTIRKLKPAGKWPVIAFGLTAELLRRPVDLLHASFVPPPVVPGRFVATMTCWSQYAQPEYYPPLLRWRLRYLLDRGVPRAAGVFCYTQYLKEKVIERFQIEPARIFVTPPGLGEEMKRVEDTERLRCFLRGLGIDRKYILFIGSLTRRKNVERLILAYHQLVREAKIEHQLVLVGETLFRSRGIFETIAKLGLGDRIVLPGRHPHGELPLFYSGADVFAFPTLSEGFGLPPLEAMACGTPVVASNVTSVPEVLGDAALMFDPSRPEEIAESILKTLTDDDLRNELVRRGKANSAKYSWVETARHIVSAYETIHQAGW